MLRLWFIVNTLLWPFNIETGRLKLWLNVIVLTIVGATWIGQKLTVRLTVSGYSAKVLLGLFTFLSFSFLVAISGPCTDKLEKLVITAPILFFLIFVSLEVGSRATDDDWLKLQKAATWVLAVAFVGFIVEALLPASFPNQAAYRSVGQLSGLFSEPSHVSFSLFPVVAILLVAESKKLRRNGLIALCGLVLLSRSSTLFALIAAWFLYRLFMHRRLGRNLFIGLGLSIVVGLAILVNYDLFVAPTLARIGGVIALEEAENVSSLVYLQGWQDVWANVLRTKGLGLGFNMMGCNPLPDVPARTILANVYDLELNSEDGAMIFAKLVSEAGVIGILFFLGIIWWLVRIEADIRSCSPGKATAAISIQSALIFSFVAIFLIRSTGYFSGSVLLLAVAVAGSVKWRKNANRRIKQQGLHVRAVK
jgi:hypothetical protein